MKTFGEVMFTPSVAARQETNGSRDTYARMAAREAAPLGPDERAFIETRDSFYMATVSEGGFPYVQHRGGPAGFLKLLGEGRLGFADYRGNQQYVSAGNLDHDDRVSLFLMDYPRKARLKILGHARMVDADDDLAANLSVAGQGRVERACLIDVVAFDWNCPKFITPRFTETEIEAMLGPKLRAVGEENARLRARLSELEGQTR